MKDKIYNAFQALGFKLNPLGEHFYRFEYEEITFAWLPNDDDPSFLNLAIPCILERKDINELTYYQIMDFINSTEMYIKANTYSDGMWLFYERELLGDEEDLENTLSHMILHLEASFQNFYQAVKAAHEREEQMHASEEDPDYQSDENKDHE